MICRKCKNPAPVGSNYCVYCGRVLTRKWVKLILALVIGTLLAITSVICWLLAMT